MESSLSMKDFSGYPPHNKVFLSSVTQDKDGLRELVAASMWNEVLKLCATQEERFLLSYAIALQHINAPDPAQVLLEKVGEKHPFSLRLMKAYLLGGEKSVKALFPLLFEMERRIKTRFPSEKTFFPVRKRKVSFYKKSRQSRVYGNLTPISNVGLGSEGAVPSRSLPTVLSNFPIKMRKSETSSHRIVPTPLPTSTMSTPSPSSLPRNLEINKKSSSSSSENDVDVDENETLEILKQRERRICFFIITSYLQDGNIPSAIQMLEIILSHEANSTTHSLLGVMYLSQGQVERARFVFNEVKKHYPKEIIHHLMNEGYEKISENKFEEAIEKFQKVLEIDYRNLHAVNNLAVCYLYNKSIDMGIEVLEEFIKKHPYEGLNQFLVKNLVIFYTLKNQIGKKRFLYELVSKYCGDDFPTAILK